MRPDRRTLNGSPRGRSRRQGGRRRGLSGRGMLQAAVFLLFAAGLYGTLVAGQRPLGVSLGEIAPRDFKARAPFTRVNLERTRAARETARLAEPAVFRLTPERWDAGMQEFLQAVREGQGSLLWQTFPEGFDRAAFARIVPRLQSRMAQLEAGLAELSALHWADPRDLAQDLLRGKTATEVILRDAAGPQRRLPLSRVHELQGDSPVLREALAGVLGNLAPAEADMMRRGIALALEADLELDLEGSAESAERAAAAQQEVAELVDAGRIILAQGSEVDRQHIEDLTREREQYRASGAGRVVRLQRLAGVAIVLLLASALAVLYARRFRPTLLGGGSQLAGLVLLTLAPAVLARLCVVWAATPLWVPVPLVVMVMCLVYDQRVGAAAAVFYALLVRLACPGADMEFVALLLGGVTTALFTAQVKTRSTLMVAGLLAGLVQFCAVWGLGFMSVLDGVAVPLRFWQSPFLLDSLIALGIGIASGFVASGMLPAIEKAFGITTDIRLLEWSDPNQPLLQRLLLDAPGTYHHSMVVGSLAAEAAEAIGANPLLARVSAYFHDVGKLKKPEYFAENLPEGGDNPHDELSPTMSSLIITAHPKDGAEMAQQYGVPPVVRDIILQSHGSSVLNYFWRKAQKANGAKGGEAEEHRFRYRLPKPHGKEAAVVMICDAVESAARSLESPSAGQLRNLVRDIILERLHDGQFDESGLTVTDLKRLGDCLVRGLTAVFHSRVSYPGPKDKQQVGSSSTIFESEGNGAGDKQPAERP